jgi:hypothetical protein
VVGAREAKVKRFSVKSSLEDAFMSAFDEFWTGIFLLLYLVACGLSVLSLIELIGL